MQTVRLIWIDEASRSLAGWEGELPAWYVASGTVTPPPHPYFPGPGGAYNALPEAAWRILDDTNPLPVLLHESHEAHTVQSIQHIRDASEEANAATRAYNAVVELVEARIGEQPGAFSASPTVTSTEKTARGLAVVGRCVVLNPAALSEGTGNVSKVDEGSQPSKRLEGAAVRTEQRCEHAHELAKAIDQQMDVWDDRVQLSTSIRPRPPTAFPPSMGDYVDEDVSLCWRAIATAGEHVAMVRAQTTGEPGGVRAKPQLTLARTVMMGAAKAIYLLEPDEAEERRIRAVRLLHREYSDASHLMNDLKDHLDGVDEDPEYHSSHATVQRRLAYYESVLEQYGYTKRKRNLRATDTFLLQESARFLEGFTRPEFAVAHLWRLSSGFAHANSWVWDAAAAGLETQPMVVQFVTIWSPPLGMLDAAWNLWNRRRGVDEPIQR